MKVQRLNDLSALSDDDYIRWKRSAIHNGYITNDTSYDQINRIYQMQQIQNAGLDPSLSLDEANTILAGKKLLELEEDRQLGSELTPLIKLYEHNPKLASDLTKELFDSGYLTRDEIDKKSQSNINNGGEEGTSYLRGVWSDVTAFFGRDRELSEDQDKDEFSTRAFNDYYKKAKESLLQTRVGRAKYENDSDKLEEDATKLAREYYLQDQNKNIFSSINKKIDNYYEQLTDQRADSKLEEFNKVDTSPEATNKIIAEADKILEKNWEEEYTDEYGETRTIKHSGSSFYKEFKDSAFDDFTVDDKKRVLAKYQSYRELFGPEKADQWLNDTMQTWVADHLPLGQRWINTAKSFYSTVASNVGPRMLSFGVYGLAKVADWGTQLVGSVTGHAGESNAFGEIASVISTGKTLAGQSPEEAGFARSLGNNGAAFWLRQDYLNKVDQYNTWSQKEQQRIEQNQGISRYSQYVLKPGQTSPDFWSFGTVQDISGMTSQIVGQAAAVMLYGGANFESLASMAASQGARAVLTKEGMKTIAAGFKDAALTSAPIAESYAYNAYLQTYNGALQQAIDNTFQSMTSEQWYKDSRESAYQQTLGVKGNIENGLSVTIDSPENRARFYQQYDAAQYEKLKDDIQSGKRKDLSSLVQASALDTYMTSFLGELSKYGMLNAVMNPLKVYKSPTQVLTSELKANTYGKLTQSAAGKFVREKFPLLGVKKWATANPKIIGSYMVARNALVQGGFSNYTDELTTGFAMGYGLSQFNSEYLRRYDPEAYARTWHGGSAVGQFMQAVGEGVSGGVKAGLTEQAFHAFEIGALGGIFAPRLAGRNKMKERYAQENAEYKKPDSKPTDRMARIRESLYNGTKGFRQKFNTYVTGSIGEYELARMTMKDQSKAIAAYNSALDERDRLFTDLASLNSGITNAIIAGAQNDFAGSAAAQDALAMKLLYNEKRLSSNPLHQLSNQQMQTDIAQLHYIAQGAVSEEEKNRLITQALTTSQTTSQKPVTQEMRDAMWEDIKTSARRMTQFIDDFYEEGASLTEIDPSLKEPENEPLLFQRAELGAQGRRIRRDIEQLSKESGIQIDPTRRGAYGQMTESQKSTLITGAQKTIDRLIKSKESNSKKLEELNSKLDKEKNSEKIKTLETDIANTKAQIRGADRSISELQRGIEAIENSELLRSSTNMSQDAIVLDDMLSNPDQYTEAQQTEIGEFKRQIGPYGETYIKELAKLQDALIDNQYSQTAIQEHPKDFLLIKTAYDAHRQEARDRAVYEQKLSNDFSKISGLAENLQGITAATWLSSEEFLRLQQEYPDLKTTLQQYSAINEAFNAIKTLFNPQDETMRINVLEKVASLMYDDFEYFRDNGSQGLADLLQFLVDIDTENPAKTEAMKTLLTDFKRVSSIEQSTTAYTEYRLQKLYEKSREEAEKLAEQLQKAQQKEQQEASTAQKEEVDEDIPDMASMENNLGEVIDLDDSGESTDTEKPKGNSEVESSSGTEKSPETSETPTEAKSEEAKTTTEELPSGVTRDSEGNLETMTTQEQAEQLGITAVNEDSMIDDEAPNTQETTDQQEEVHGCYFNPYKAESLRMGDLVPVTEGPIYEWLIRENIKLGDIIDNELANIIKVNPRIQLMNVRTSKNDASVSSNIFLVVEYTDKVAKHHLPENGGVITSNGKQYLIVGTMWNTKSQDGTEAANIMTTVRDNLQKNSVNYFNSNPSERFYVDPVMNTEVTTFYSGHIIHTIDGDTGSHTMQELLDEHNRTHTPANQMSMEDLGFGAIVMRDFYPVGPVSRVHKPQNHTIDKYGQVYVLVPAANGETIPIFINPTLLSEIKEGYLKTTIDTVLIPKLLDPDFSIREQAKAQLCQLLCITGSITNRLGKGILIGTKDIATVSLVNGESVICTFDIKKGTLKYRDGRVNSSPSIKDFIDAIYELNPRINLNLDNLKDKRWIQRYDEAGALTTDSTKLGTYGSKYYVAPINPATGQPLRVEQKSAQEPIPLVASSDYSRAQSKPYMLPVGGQTYVLRNGKWVHQKDGSAVTDKAEQVQVEWAYKVQTKQAQLAKNQGLYKYYVTGIETSEPIVVAYNISTRKFEGVTPEVASQIIAERRAELERNRADAEAKKQLESRQPVEEAPKTSQPSESPQQSTINRPQDGYVRKMEYTTRTGKKISGGFVVSSRDGYTHIKRERLTYLRVSVEDIGLPIDKIIGPKDSYNTEEAYNGAVQDAIESGFFVDEITINPEGEVSVDVGTGTITGEAARIIYDKFFDGQFEAPEVKQEPAAEEKAATEQRQAQQKLARVEEALNSPEVKLWSDNPQDNVIITTSYDGFSSPMKESRLWRTAGDYRDALKMNEGDVFRDKFRVVYKGKNGITYIEKLNAKDGQVKSAIVVPTSGRGGDNYTLHFYTTLDTASRRLIIDKLIDMKGAYSEELMSAALMLMQSGNNLSYLQYRDQRLLNELKSKASGSNIQTSPAKQKNDFELSNTSTTKKYTVDEILDSVDEVLGDYAVQILDIIDAKIKEDPNKWGNFDKSNISGELQRLGIDTSNIEDIESWIENLKDCE